MGKFAKLHAMIKERCTEPGAYYFPDPWWKKEVDAITDDIDTAIEFVRSECSDEELICMFIITFARKARRTLTSLTVLWCNA